MHVFPNSSIPTLREQQLTFIQLRNINGKSDPLVRMEASILDFLPVWYMERYNTVQTKSFWKQQMKRCASSYTYLTST